MCGFHELNAEWIMSSTRSPGDFRPDESPIAWFGEMFLAIDRGDFVCAAESQRELDRLGWRVTRKRSRLAPHQTAARPEGVTLA
jgi:hypothetical protein